jgi:type I restriction enzyme S subunit
LPDGWAFARINSLVYIQTGASFKKEQATTDSTQTRVLRGGNILQGEYKFFDNDIFIDSQLVSDSILLLKNDLITPAVTSIENIGKLALIEQDYNKVTAGGFVFIIRPCFNSDVFARYMLYALQSSYFNKQLKSITKKSGQAFYNLGKERLIQLIVPIPPIKEQELIVNEIEKFAPLINEYNLLEQEATKLDTEIYDKLKKSILQYAIQGKLVEQDETDEPASVLLERIRSEKKVQLGKKYVASYIYKGDDNCYYEHIGGKDINITEEIPFDLPNGWEWTRLKNVINSLTDGTHSTPKYTASGVPFISVKDVSSGKLSFENTKFISYEEHSELTKRCKPQRGDILLTKVGTTGIPVLIDSDIEFSLFVSVALIKFNAVNILPEYFIYILKSPLVQEQATENTRGVGNKNWVLSDIEKTLLVLPPLAEQKRIVDKINEIFAKL